MDEFNLISYHDYIAMFCNSDTEWANHRIDSENHEELLKSIYNNQNFNEICWDYRKNIEEYFKEYLDTNKSIDHSESINKKIDGYEPIADHLFNPIYYITPGHSDILNLVLLDDFDPIQHITSNLNGKIEDIDIAFCPQIKTYKLLKESHKVSSYDKIFELYKINNNIINRYLKVFTDLHLVFNRPVNYKEKEINFFEHPIQTELPLVTFTKFKTISHGVIFQNCLLRAMAYKIISTCNQIENLEGVNCLNIKIFNNNYRENLKIVFLDLLGREEIGLLIFTDNYSLSISLISALRSITWEDLTACDNSGLLLKSIDNNLLEQLNYKLVGLPELKDHTLEKNHVFRWSYTTNGISPVACLNPDRIIVDCLVEAYSEIQVLPGHHMRVVNNIEEIDDKFVYENSQILNLEKKDYQLYFIGISDYIFQNKIRKISNNDQNINKLLPLRSFIKILNANLIKFGSKKGINSVIENKFTGRHIKNLTSNIAIPIPNINKDLDPNHYSLLSESLATLKDFLFNLNKPEKVNSGNTLNENKIKSPLDINKLKEIPQYYGLPKYLRRSIENLYQNFSIIFSDPYLFDSVIDLYDTFSTLHRLLTDDIYLYYKNIQEQFRKEVVSTNKLVYIDSKNINQLALLVDSLYNAFIHRIGNPYPDSQYHEIEVDFRGDFQQVLYAADAIIKCGVSLVRRLLSGNDGYRFDNVGVLVKIGFSPGASCNLFSFTPNENIRLATIELDVPHVLHVASYLDNFHETMHLVFEELIKKEKFGNDFCNTFYDEEKSSLQIRLNEIFVLLLSHLFIFGSNKSKFLFYHLTYYSKNSFSSESNDSDIMFSFTDFFIRFFITQYIVPEKKKIPPYNINDFELEKYIDTNKAKKCFRETIKQYGPLFSEYERLMDSYRGFEEFYLKQFEIIYNETKPFFLDLINQFIAIQKIYIHDSYEEYFIKKKIHSNNLLIKQRFEECCPIPVSEFIERNFVMQVNSETQDFFSIILMGHLLFNYTIDTKVLKQEIFSSDKKLTKNIHLYRDKNTRQVGFPKINNKKWFVFQIDKGVTQSFCPVPKERSRRIKKQIVMIKSFGDISALQRNNILKEIVSDYSKSKDKM